MTDKYDITDYLKDDKELQKAVIEEFLKENSELKDENDRLRTCLDTQRIDETNQYITKVNVERENYKLKQTFQEIKKIVNARCNECKYGKDGISCKYGDCGEAKLHLITQLIAKVESEG